MLTALTISAVVCIASSNGGTTSQDLKTGFLVGATPKKQQLAIMVGALTSAVVIAGTLLVLNAARTHYTNKNLPDRLVDLKQTAPQGKEKVGRPHEKEDQTEYHIVHVRKGDYPEDADKGLPEIKEGRYLVDAEGHLKYRTDMPIKRKAPIMDNGEKAEPGYSAPQPQLFASIIEGILGGSLEWGLVIIGVLIAVGLELMGVSALPVAVGMYLELNATMPIFIGGLLRWVADQWKGKSGSDAEAETSPGILLASGYIAGGTLIGLLISFLVFVPDFAKALDIGKTLFGDKWDVDKAVNPKILALIMYASVGAILLRVAIKRPTNGATVDRT
jgi:hypothetical protein